MINSHDSLQQAPLLVGVVIDVSNSMRKNLRNQDGKKLPRIEVVRDTLNKHIKQAQQQMQLQQGEVDEIDLFCLGMGFKAPMHLNNGNLSPEKEHSLGNTARRLYIVDLVCDLLALGEILPSQEELTDFKQQLDLKWQGCYKEVLDRSTIPQDAYAELVEYLQQGLYETAMRKLHTCIVYRLSRIQKVNRLFPILRDIIKEREGKIAVTAKVAAAQYADDVFNRTSRDFQANTNHYIKIIHKHLHEFAQSYTASTLRALTLGFKIKELVDDLDIKIATTLAKQIQADLEKEVEKHIQFALSLHLGKLYAASHSITASLNKKKIRQLTERFIRKFGWDILRPLIADTINTIFVEQFEEQAKENLPYWIQLSSTREVVRPLNHLNVILPDVIEENVYSETFMFGSTPFMQAIDKAAVRFINDMYKGREKVLIIISDGDFENVPAVMVAARLLKRRGVTIISCLISERDILSRLMKRSLKDWPLGAQKMIEIASSASEQENDKWNWSNQRKVQTLSNEKLCIQINHSVILDDVLEIVFGNSKASAKDTD